ncbi:hypothetical protein F4780DRAFT_783948 [Xylariomycetidae sp. FL0641]|nr:hypothetical protein F4780DRAFT_783948 [Xylariomycetidae sp. FL0641]
MTDADLYVSNGECFYGEGSISDPRFIPCGNAAVAGTQACCFQGDFCLAENVCYDNDTAVTYITGCTDPTYSSSKCPHKPGYLTQIWVALARCDGDDIDLFSGCAHHTDDTHIDEQVVIKHEDCTCDAALAIISNPASGQPTLNQLASLPPTAGGTISFNPTAVPTATTSSSASDSPSTGAKVGIGVGVGVGVPLIAATAFMFFFLRRRKRKATQQPQPETSQPEIQQTSPTSVHPPPSELSGGTASPPPLYSPESQNALFGWLRHKPELHSDQANKIELSAESYANDEPAARRELAAEPNSRTSSGVNRMDSIQTTPHDNYRYPRDSYPPSERMSEYSESQRGASPPASSFISPQTTGDTERPGGHQTASAANMHPISEHDVGRQYSESEKDEY